MKPELRSELRAWLDFVAERAAMYYGTPEHAEGALVTLIQTLHSMENDCSFAESWTIIQEEIEKIVKDVPHAPSQRVFLCEETAIPERVRSFPYLRKRLQILMKRVLKDPSS